MNERIRELYIQTSNETADGKEWAIGGMKNAERFAELIVNECINEIAYIGKANEVFGDRPDRDGLNHILWTTETAIKKIKEHFGVE